MSNGISKNAPKAIRWAGRVILGMAAFLIGVMSIIIIVNVISRYVFSESLTWSAEAAEYSMVWGTMLAASVLVIRHEHLAVDLLPRLSSEKASKALRLTVYGGSLCLFVAMCYLGIMLVIRTSGQVASSLRFLPMNAVYSVIPVSGLIMTVGTVCRIVGEIRGATQK